MKMLGEIKWFDRTKGYGFILIDEGRTEVFFIACEVGSDEDLGRLYRFDNDVTGWKVKFRLEKRPKGFAASGVELVD